MLTKKNARPLLRGKEWHRLKGHTDSVTSARFLADGKWLATLARDGELLVWNLDAMECARRLQQVSHFDFAFHGLLYRP